MGQDSHGLDALGELLVVARIQKVFERHAHERRVSQETGSVSEPVLERFGQLVKVGGRSRARLALPFSRAIGEDAEDFNHDRSARRRWRHGKHAVAEEVRGQGLPLQGCVSGKIRKGKHPPRSRCLCDQVGRDFAAIEGLGAFPAQPLQGRCEGRAGHASSCAKAGCSLAIDGEDLGHQVRAGGGIALDFVTDLLGQPGRDRKTSRKAKRGFDASSERKSPESPDKLAQPARLARHADRETALGPDACASYRLGGERRGRGFAKIEGHCLAAVGQIDEGETTAPQPRSKGVDYAQCQCGCTGRIDGISTGFEHFHAGG